MASSFILPSHAARAVASAALLLAIASLPLVAQPLVTLSAPCGDGSARIHVSGAVPNTRLFNLISVVPANPTGSGPLFGLSIDASLSIIAQILSPYPTPPTYVSSNFAGNYTWSLCLPPGAPIVEIPVDVVCLEWSPITGYLRHSAVATRTFRL